MTGKWQKERCKKLEMKFKSTGETRPIKKKKSSSSVYVKSQCSRYAVKVEKVFLLENLCVIFAYLSPTFY